MRKSLLTVAACAITAATVLASTDVVAGAGPFGEQAARYPSVHILQWSNDLQPSPSRLRRAQSNENLVSWIRTDDPQVQRLVSLGDQSASVMLQLEIAADGAMGACRIESAHGDPQWSEGLCETIRSRVRLRPAIDMDGRPMTDAIRVSIEFWWESSEPGRLVEIGATPPAGAPPRPPSAWPPAPRPTPSVSGLALIHGGPDAPEARGEPWSGVNVRPGRTGSVSCQIVASSGDAEFERRACAAAQAASYNFSGPQASRQGITVLFIKQEGEPRALLPLERMSRAAVQPESLAEIRTRLSAAGYSDLGDLKMVATTGPDGRAVRCAITVSSDSDALDVLACRLVREYARFTPARDVFGRPQEGGLYINLPAAPS